MQAQQTPGVSPTAQVSILQVDLDETRSHTFDPDKALGTSIDVLHDGDVDRVYSAPILKESLSAGWGPMSYRLNTELRIAAWHWNSHGTWSDTRKKVDTSPEARSLESSCAIPTPIRYRIVVPRETKAQTMDTRASPTAMSTPIGRAIRT